MRDGSVRSRMRAPSKDEARRLTAAKTGFEGVPFCIDQKRRQCFVFRNLRRFVLVFVYRPEMPENCGDSCRTFLFVSWPSSFAISRASLAAICGESYGTGCGVTDVNAVNNEREKARPEDSCRRTERISEPAEVRQLRRKVIEAPISFAPRGTRQWSQRAKAQKTIHRARMTSAQPFRRGRSTHN